MKTCLWCKSPLPLKLNRGQRRKYCNWKCRKDAWNWKVKLAWAGAQN